MKLSKGEDLGARKSDFFAKSIKAQWNYARCLQAVQNVRIMKKPDAYKKFM